MAKASLKQAGGFCHEEEVFCRADRVCAEASRGGCADCGADPQDRDTEQTYYRWKAKYAGLEVDRVRQIKQFRDENTKLKQLVAELTLDKTMLQDVLRKKL